jgi:Leucine-rich repeat (LRR) protein
MISVIEEAFNTCKTLKKLDLSVNHIRKIENLICSELLELNLSKNQIDRIIPGCLDGLKQLRILDLSMNKIVKIEGLRPVSASLERLILYGNQIEVIEGLDFMQKLKEINLKKNKIYGSSVSKLAGNPTLMQTIEILNLSYNQI